MGRSLLKKITFFLFIAITLALVGFLALPHIVDRIVLPSLLASTPFSFSRAQMSRITPYLVEGSVEIKDGDNPVLSIPRFQIRFTPQSLLQKKISSLVLDHATLHFRREKGRLIVPGFKPQTGSQNGKGKGDLYLLPFGVESMILEHCRILVHDPQNPSLHLEVNGQIAPTFGTTGGQNRLEALNGSLFFSDDLSAAVTGSATLEGEDLAVNLAIRNGALSLPEELFPEWFTPPRFKTLAADLALHFDATSFSLQGYELSGSVVGLRYITDRFSLTGGEADQMLDFTLSGDLQTHRFQIAPIALKAPVEALIEIEGEALYRNKEARTSGRATMTWPGEDGEKTDPHPLFLSFNGQWTETSGAALQVDGDYHSPQPLPLPKGWSISGLQGLHFSSSIEAAPQQLRAELDLQSGPLELRHDAMQLTTSPIDVDLSLSRSPGQLDGKLRTALDAISLPEKHLRLKNLKVDLPFSHPTSAGSAAPGSLSIEAVEIENEHLFSLAADLVNHGSVYVTDGTVKLLHNPDVDVDFNGQLIWPSKTGTLSWHLITDALDPGLLPAFLSLPADLDFSGRLEAQGNIGYDRSLRARVQAAIVDGSVHLQDKNFSLVGLNCTIEFPNLPKLQSSPSQRCTASAIDISSLHFSDASFTFRVEHPQSLFIERSKLHWCGGTLESGSLRLSKEISEIDTTLFCSRIGLAELLDQFGFKGTEGEGSLNGKLPIRLARDRIDFEDGFLFSTPGTGGIVRFSDTDLLRQGVGAVSEAGFLNYTLQALEDFTYNWTKLTFDSGDDDLLMTLELDGKPSTALPFKFNKQGMLVESDQGKGLQYPIRLDVNFRIPLVELFQIGQSINTIMGSGQ